jgi:small subunit ribosomal protein S6
MRNYELICILEAAPAEELKTIEKSLLTLLEKREVTVGKTESWGQRPLYHEAKKKNEGVFQYYEIQANPEKIEQINQDFKVTLGILKATICRAT